MCGVTYKRFDFSRLPRHVVDLYKYSWKPIVILVSLSGFIVKRADHPKLKGGGYGFLSSNIFRPQHKHTSEENFSKTLLFSFFRFQEMVLKVLKFVLENKIICILQYLLGWLFTKSWIFSDIIFGVTFSRNLKTFPKPCYLNI